MIEIIPNWHPLFVHFTVALFSLSTIFFVIQRPLAETEMGDNFMVFARYTLWLGVLFSIATLVAGWDAYNTVNHDTPSHTAMTEHRNWGIVTFVVFLVAAIWWFAVNKISEKASIAFLLCLFVGAGLLVTTGHKGSQLVYFYGLGVESLPKKDDHTAGGAHSHGGGHSHDSSNAHGESLQTPDDHHANDLDDAAPHAHDDAHKHDDMAPSGHDHGDTINAPMTNAPMTHADDLSMDGVVMEPESDSKNTHAEKAKAQPMKNNTDAELENAVIEEPAKQIELKSAALENAQPKIEKYEDGTIRQTLPDVAIDIQE